MDESNHTYRPDSDPTAWVLPQWHPDWDGEFQLESLREFAKSLRSSTAFRVGLSIIEEGYAHLDVLREQDIIGSVYVNRSEEPTVPQFSIFAGADEEELHTTNAASAIEFLERVKSPLSNDAT